MGPASQQVAWGCCSRRIQGPGLRRGRALQRWSLPVVPAVHGRGRPLPAWPAPGATRARPRGRPCCCPAPRTGDPSAAAAPRRRSPPAWRSPGGEGRPRSDGLGGGFTAPPPPPGSPQGQLPRPHAPQPPRCGAKQRHLLEVINASRPRPRQNLRLLLRPALLGGGGRGRRRGRGKDSRRLGYCISDSARIPGTVGKAVVSVLCLPQFTPFP